MKHYRYQIRYSESRISGLPNVVIDLYEFDVVKETPCGYWIKDNFEKRWVLKKSKRRYAYPTKKEALDNLIKRTKRRRGILKYQVAVCDTGVAIAMNMKI